MCPRCQETAFRVSELFIFMGGGCRPPHCQGFAPSMSTIMAFLPETRTYLPLEINLQNMKYILCHYVNKDSQFSPTFLKIFSSNVALNFTTTVAHPDLS